MTKKQKFLTYGRQTLGADERRAVQKVLQSNFITQGPEVPRFEKLAARALGVRYAVAVSSGTAGLHIAALAAGFKKGDEVVTTPLSFIATSNAILYAGARPVFADIDPATTCLDPLQASLKINKKTKGIIAVDMAGHPCDVKKFKALCAAKKLTFIQDASHSLGAEVGNRSIGGWADMTVFSFHPVKTITTGEGGMVVTNNKGLYEKLIRLRNHGIERSPGRFLEKNEGPWYYEMQNLGFNYRMTDFQAALGSVQIKRLKGFIQKRRKIARFYQTKLAGIPWLTLPKEKSGNRSAWHLFLVQLDFKTLGKTREQVFREFRKKQIGLQVHYIPITHQPYYVRSGLSRGSFPQTERYYARCVSLPLHPGLTGPDLNRVVSAVKGLKK